ncbi:MAG TPA: hypothetical protein VEQ10_00960, partial [Vicinamibacteria bacterium]|nr:hypothetical protein [Vicinamibacteria bacterium]
MKRALSLLLVLTPAAALLADGSAIDLARQQWNGNAVCYSGYRLGQHPDQERFPSQAQVLEDLRILERNFRLIRTYGSDQHSRDVLEVIRRHGV